MPADVLVASTYKRLGFWCDGTSVKFYIDGELVATHTTGIPTSGLMAPFIALTTNADAPRVLIVDYVKSIQLR
jgi:hypothetical protein